MLCYRHSFFLEAKRSLLCSVIFRRKNSKIYTSLSFWVIKACHHFLIHDWVSFLMALTLRKHAITITPRAGVIVNLLGQEKCKFNDNINLLIVCCLHWRSPNWLVCSVISTLYKSAYRDPWRILPKVLKDLSLELFLKITSRIESEFNEEWTGSSGKIGIQDPSVKPREIAWP